MCPGGDCWHHSSGRGSQSTCVLVGTVGIILQVGVHRVQYMCPGGNCWHHSSCRGSQSTCVLVGTVGITLQVGVHRVHVSWWELLASFFRYCRSSQSTCVLVYHLWWNFDLPTFLPFTFTLCFYFYINRYIHTDTARWKLSFLFLWKYKLQISNIPHRLFCFDIVIETSRLCRR